MENRPSIFNDVIGPVMRGPSSSHTAASWRIARVAVQLLNEELAAALIEFDRDGAWAANYREQGTVLGMDGGLLGLDLRDEEVLRASSHAREAGIGIEYRVSSFASDHENTVRMSLRGRSGKTLSVLAVSTGGGMFELRRINDQSVSIRGDQYCLLTMTNDGRILEQIDAPSPFSEERIIALGKGKGVAELISVDPVLPVVSGRSQDCPFDDFDGMLHYAASGGYSLGRIGLLYEACRSGMQEEELLSMMKDIVEIVEAGIERGLAGTEYADRILHRQAELIKDDAGAGPVDPLVKGIIANVTALMEAKSAMELIVAIPTAGSCGTFGGSIKAYCDRHAIDEERKLLAYFAGGMPGVFFAAGPGFSAELYGCQVETGAAGAMAAAALAELMGGNAIRAMAAASMALQNCIGLVCDPVADRVEVPCLGRNVSAGLNALGAATMALAGFEQVVPFDQVLDTVRQVGRSISPALRCTGKGGLSVTPASKEWKKKLGQDPPRYR